MSEAPAATATQGSLDHATYVEHVRTQGAAFVAAVRAADPDLVVRSYPGFRVWGLASHVGRVVTSAAHAVTEGTFPWLKPEDAPADHGALPDWVEAQLATLVAALETEPASKAIEHPFTTGPQNVGFIPRYLSSEIGTHRWDAQSALGAQQPLPADLADDAIDYTSEIWLPGFGSEATLDLDVTIGLQATDTGSAWIVSTEASKLRIARSDQPADLTVHGTASDLFLLLWKRIEPTTMSLSFSGDADASALGRLLATDYVISAKTMAFH